MRDAVAAVEGGASGGTLPAFTSQEFAKSLAGVSAWTPAASAFPGMMLAKGRGQLATQPATPAIIANEYGPES